MNHYIKIQYFLVADICRGGFWIKIQGLITGNLYYNHFSKGPANKKRFFYCYTESYRFGASFQI